MKFSELVKDVNWQEVKESLQKFYEYNKTELSNHQIVFEKLKYIEPVENDMRITVAFQEPDGWLVEEGYWYVDGKKCTEDFADSEVGFALDFTPWNEWLGMEIDQESANDIRLMRADIVALCLYEMTFHGYDESDIQEVFSELEKKVKEIQNMPENELNEKYSNVAELKKRLKKLMEDIESQGEDDAGD